MSFIHGIRLIYRCTVIKITQGLNQYLLSVNKRQLEKLKKLTEKKEQVTFDIKDQIHKDDPSVTYSFTSAPELSTSNQSELSPEVHAVMEKLRSQTGLTREETNLVCKFYFNTAIFNDDTEKTTILKFKPYYQEGLLFSVESVWFNLDKEKTKVTSAQVGMKEITSGTSMTLMMEVPDFKETLETFVSPEFNIEDMS